MSTISDNHEKAMALTDEALVSKRCGDATQALRLFREALEYERRAAEAVATDLTMEPTRSVLHRSAAALA